MDPESDYQQLVDQLPDLICRYRPDGLLLYVNESYAAYYEQEADELVGQNFLDLIPAEFRHEVEISLAAVHALTPDHPVVVNEHRSADHAGRLRWQQWTDKGVFDDHGRLVEVMAIGRDVTERRMAEEQAAYQASHDPLTGLLNRRSLMRGLGNHLRRARVNGQMLAVLYVDLDSFKQLNDELGHSTGDRVLEEVAERLVAAFRATDLVGRIGGDEFVVVCPDIGSGHQLMPLVERLRSVLAEPMLGLTGHQVEASVGWSLSQGQEDAEDVLNAADAAMYQVKQSRSEPL